MKKRLAFGGVALTTLTLLAVVSPTPDTAGAAAGPRITRTSGVVNLLAGVDQRRMREPAYFESLTGTAQRLTAVASAVRSALNGSQDIVDFGNAAGTNSLVVYWSGPADSAAVRRIHELARRHGVNLVVAARKVSRARLDSAERVLLAHRAEYKRRGIFLSMFGGFAPDFDGVEVIADPVRSTQKDAAKIQALLQSDVGVPVRVTLAETTNFVGRYDDYQPFYGGTLMVGPSGELCTSGFGIVKGSSVYRYLTARHCDASLYRTDTGNAVMGGVQQRGTGHNGSAIMSAQGGYSIWVGGNVGSPTETRRLTQKDPALSTSGTPVCQEGANSGQRCGVIKNVRADWDDGLGIIRVNSVVSTNNSIIGARGDSGAPVISLHTLGRAWSVGILQGGIGPFSAGAACGTRYLVNACSTNFVFNNIDYAMGGFTGWAVRYG